MGGTTSRTSRHHGAQAELLLFIPYPGHPGMGWDSKVHTSKQTSGRHLSADQQWPHQLCYSHLEDLPFVVKQFCDSCAPVTHSRDHINTCYYRE